MQCANLLRKRSVEGEAWSCRAKRMCLEAELQTVECPMETSHTLSLANHHQEQEAGVVRPRPLPPPPLPPPPLCCQRCLGGEPGHINHIMGH